MTCLLFASIGVRGGHLFDEILKPENLALENELPTTLNVLAKLHRLDVVISTCHAASGFE